MTEMVKQPPNGLEVAYSQARIEPSPQPTMMDLLQLAINKEGSIDVIERLAKLQLESQDRAAKVAFAKAFAEFKEHMPRIIKTAAITVNGQVRGMYAPLDKICDALIPALIHVGLTHRWKSDPMTDGGIRVTCYLKHILGYEEEGSTMAAPPDTSGSKNAVQAHGSTMSYLQRYTLIASCGIAVQGQDTDGVAPEDLMTDSVASDFLSAIEGSGSVDELKSNYFKAQEAAKKDQRALRVFAEAKNKMYRKLERG